MRTISKRPDILIRFIPSRTELGCEVPSYWRVEDSAGHYAEDVNRDDAVATLSAYATGRVFTLARN